VAQIFGVFSHIEDKINLTTVQEAHMAIASLIFGILSVMGACVAMIPIITVINYCINLPLALLGTLLGISHLVRFREIPNDKLKGVAIAGLVLNILALVMALGRLIFSLVISGYGIL